MIYWLKYAAHVSMSVTLYSAEIIGCGFFWLVVLGGILHLIDFFKREMAKEELRRRQKESSE